jgi:hypothetical protein
VNIICGEDRDLAGRGSGEDRGQQNEGLDEMNKKEDPDETNKAANPMLERAKGIIEHIWQTKKNPKKKKKSKR